MLMLHAVAYEALLCTIEIIQEFKKKIGHIGNSDGLLDACFNVSLIASM